MMDDGSGNKTGIPLAVSYAITFKTLRSVFERKADDFLTPKDKPSTCWALKMTHPTPVDPALERCLGVTDNFYNRHNLAAQVRVITDNEVSSLGKVRLNTTVKPQQRKWRPGCKAAAQCRARRLASMSGAASWQETWARLTRARTVRRPQCWLHIVE